MAPRLPISQDFRWLGEMSDALGRVKKTRLNLSKYSSLAPLAQEYTFFTPALLYLHGAFLESMWLDYMYELGEPVNFYHYKFEKPLFEGLHTPDGDRDWNHVLWLMEKPFYPSLEDFVCSLSIAHRERRQFRRYGVQRLTLFDPCTVDRRGMYLAAAPTVEVNVFGVTDVRGQACLQAGLDLQLPPRLVFLPADPSLVAFAGGYFQDQNPFRTRETFREDQHAGTRRDDGVAQKLGRRADRDSADP